jgi:hypothetical protein
MLRFFVALVAWKMQPVQVLSVPVPVQSSRHGTKRLMKRSATAVVVLSHSSTW